ncbi:MAG: type II toxin-antitoxin system PemK/MazF family toxin [Candidatus Acidiferrales bacterium]
MPTPPSIVNQGDIYWCEPDPSDTVGSEQEGDRPWVIISTARLHRGNCAVGLPLSRHLEKACAHLIAIPKNEITMEDGNPSIDRVALTDQIRALDKRRFRRKAGHISPRAINAIRLGLDYLFGNMPTPKNPN